MTGARQLALATIFSQFALVAVLPVLTRVYSTADFALYQLAFSVAVVLQSALAGGAEFRIPVAGNEREARTLARRGLTVCLLLSLLGVALALAFWWLGSHSTAEALVGGIAIAATSCVTAIDNARLMRLSCIDALVRRSLLTGTLSIAFQIGGSFVLQSYWTLVVSVVIARMAAVTLVRVGTPREAGRETDASPDADARFTAGDATSWILGVAFSNAAVQAPVFVVAAMSGPVAAAQFAIAIRVVSMMTTVLGAGVSQGFLYEISTLIRQKSSNAVHQVNQTQKRMVAIGLVGGGFLTLIAWWCVPLVLGPAWVTAGLLSSVLALPYGLQLANRVITPLHSIVDSNQLNLLLQVTRFGVIMGSLSVGIIVGLGSIQLGILLAFLTAIFSIIYNFCTLARVRAFLAMVPA